MDDETATSEGLIGQFAAIRRCLCRVIYSPVVELFSTLPGTTCSTTNGSHRQLKDYVR